MLLNVLTLSVRVVNDTQFSDENFQKEFVILEIQWTPLIVPTLGPAKSGRNNAGSKSSGSTFVVIKW